LLAIRDQLHNVALYLQDLRGGLENVSLVCLELATGGAIKDILLGLMRTAWGDLLDVDIVLDPIPVR